MLLMWLAMHYFKMSVFPSNPIYIESRITPEREAYKVKSGITLTYFT